MSIVQAERRRVERPADVETLPCDEPPEEPAVAPQGQPWVKRLVTAWLLFHVTAVALYPAAILVPPRGLLRAISNLFFEPYMEGLYMVGGHRFFAPEPGPGTMVEYRVERADGSVEENIFPRREISPRLMYHRHFMLSERVQDVGVETEWFRMYARHLAHELGGERVTLWRVVHRLATPEDIQAGKHLTDEEFYDRRELGSWSLAELDEPWSIERAEQEMLALEAQAERDEQADSATPNEAAAEVKSNE